MDVNEYLFVDDAEVWFDGGAFSHAGRDNIIQFYQNLIDSKFISSHLVAHPEIEITAAFTATGVWRLVDTVHFRSDNTLVGAKAGDELSGAAYYYDDYQNVDGVWKIKATGFVRIFQQVESSEGRSLNRVFEPSLGKRS